MSTKWTVLRTIAVCVVDEISRDVSEGSARHETGGCGKTLGGAEYLALGGKRHERERRILKPKIIEGQARRASGERHAKPLWDERTRLNNF